MMSAAERFIAGLIMIMLILGLYAAAVVNSWSFTGVWNTNLWEIGSVFQTHGVGPLFWVVLFLLLVTVVGVLVLLIFLVVLL